MTSPTPAQLFDLTGRTAVVTGATGWLGRAMVGTLSAAGARVVAVARRAEPLAELADRHPGVTAHPCDVTSGEWVELVSQFGVDRPLDVLINNAHVGHGDSLRLAAPERYLEAVELAVVAAARGMNAARPGFAASVAAGGSPSVINVASMYGMVAPDPGLYDTEEGRNPPYYGAAKAGLLQLTRYAAAELGPLGVRVNALTPGPFPQHPERMDPAFVGRLAARTVLGRVGDPDDLAAALLYLCSPASRFTTGSNLVVDGGWTIT